ncbi:MAG: tRNA dihydrouridine(20/20a) synthase DusA [Alphaproteobacteria bacterium]
MITRTQRLLSVAPMMDWTDRHCRWLHRQIAPDALLYTEMVTTGAILHGDADRHLRYNSDEHPVALQLGGSDPDDLAHAAEIGASYGYDEINLNCGCPSDRVQNGRFGACLMGEPDLVASGVAAMRRAVGDAVPVTVKTRIGIDEQDSLGFLLRFVETVADAGCDVFIIHARKAWLQGLSPKQNREIPPLDYGRVQLLKQMYPELTITLNGGLTDADQVVDQMQGGLDGVMIGREAYQSPMSLASFSTALGLRSGLDARAAALAYKGYCAERMAEGVPLKSMTRHMLGLFQGRPGAKRFRRLLSERAHLPDATTAIITDALATMDEAAAYAASRHRDAA